MIELCVTAAKHSGESKMDELTVGTTITLIKEIDSTKPVGSTATVVPSISDANVSSATSAVATTFPFTGLVISSAETFSALAAGRDVGCCIYDTTNVTVSLLIFSIFLLMLIRLL